MTGKEGTASMDFERIADICGNFPKPQSFHPSYGTAGFRALGEHLHSTLFRCGILMALRSSKTKGTTGIVVTASHNPAEDNGVKLVEPSGYMLTQSWERHADELANAVDAAQLSSILKKLVAAEDISEASEGTVWIGQDTRPSCGQLVAAACQGVEAVGGKAEVKGLLTTPQLHWMVRQQNKGLLSSEEEYFKTLAQAYQRLAPSGSPSETLIIDCANGVGGSKLDRLQQHIQGLNMDLRNTGSGPLNGRCGADFVQKGADGAPCLPTGFADLHTEARCASIDGDADRVVFFSPSAQGFNLLDGDRIAVLSAILLNSLIKELPDPSSISVGIVQTAYANGNSSRYMRETLGMDVKLAKTGVKHLHHLAESYDVGIYFEANGHGTILFKETLLHQLKKVADSCQSARAILDIAELVNQAVGDAVSCLLLVDIALRRQGWSLKDWAALYTDLPSCMLKVKVPDRSIFKTTDAETKLTSPPKLQPAIDGLIASCRLGRAFVRPSGTEDVVRVYAEAKTAEVVEDLARKIVKEVLAAVN